MTKTNIKFKKINIIFLLLVFISFSFVFAQPPFQQSSETNKEAVIIFPKFEYYKENSDILLYFQIVNSTGKELSNSDYDCTINICTNDLECFIFDNLTDSDITNCKYYNLTANYTEKKQKISYYVNCNTTEGEYGYISNSFEINNDGLVTIFEYNNSWLIFFIFLSLSIIYLIISFKITSNKLKIFKILFFMLGVIFSLFMMIIPSMILLNIANITAFTGLFLSMSIIGVILLILFILIYGFKILIQDNFMKGR